MTYNFELFLMLLFSVSGPDFSPYPFTENIVITYVQTESVDLVGYIPWICEIL
jgi:hypothetical protein